MKSEYLPMQVTGNGVSQLSMNEIGERLRQRYEARGWSRTLFVNDWAMLRRVGVHPAVATTQDLERVVLRATAQGTKALYVWRFRSLFDSLRDLGICDNDAAEHLPTIRKPRGLPRPLTDAEAALLMREAHEPFRHWFVLGCMAGLRAMEVSGLTGADLENGPSGWVLRVRGKGHTDLTIPAHDKVVEVVQSYGTLGRLWELNPNKISAYACKEMRRLGVDKSFHACRHWHATALLAATGGDIVAVAELMRHSNIQTTLNYAKLGHDRPRVAISSLAMPAA